jgi:hypothetical protein
MNIAKTKQIFKLQPLIPILALAVGLALASLAVQRTGPLRLGDGEGFCPGAAPCRVPVLGAGFPVPYLIDAPQVSVPGRVALVEDDFRVGAFLANVVFYALLAALGLRLRGRWRGGAAARPAGVGR